jgi:hypothetical protein
MEAAKRLLKSEAGIALITAPIWGYGTAGAFYANKVALGVVSIAMPPIGIMAGLFRLFGG